MRTIEDEDNEKEDSMSKKARMEQQVPSDVQPYSRNISSGAHPPPHSR